MPRNTNKRSSPLAVAFLNRLQRAGVQKLSVSQQEEVDRLDAAWAQVRAEREAAGFSFLSRGGGQ